MNRKTELAIYALAGLMLAGAASIWWQGVRPSSPPAAVFEPVGALEEGVPGGEEMGGAREASVKTIFVHIEGAVANPGVHEFPEGERLFQALDTVGLLDDADTSAMNLATVLRDSQKVYVPKVGESVVCFWRWNVRRRIWFVQEERVRPVGRAHQGGSGAAALLLTTR